MNIFPALALTSPAQWRCFTLLVLAWPGPATADCVDTRRASAAETEFHSRAMAALLAALPPVPVGGKLQNPDSVTSLGQQCKGVTGDFNLEASRFYELNFRKSIITVSINARQLPVSAAGSFAAYGLASPNRSAALKVNNVVWTVPGSDSPLRQTLSDAIDRTRLEALVGKPLPSVAESRALAVQAVPATVTGGAGAAAAPAAQPANQAAALSGQAEPGVPVQPAVSEPLKDAVDAVNKLRGLLALQPWLGQNAFLPAGWGHCSSRNWAGQSLAGRSVPSSACRTAPWRCSE